MSTLPAMPDKWAVKIESEAEAVELQKLFPDAHIAYSGYDLVFCWLIKHVPYTELCLYPKVGNIWNYANKSYLETNGYTMYTLNELNNNHEQRTNTPRTIP